MFIDTHTHLYLDSFSDDRVEVMERALQNGVTRMLLPNIDSGTIQSLYTTTDQYSHICLPMMGLHPNSVKKNFKYELNTIEKQFQYRRFIAVGETGMDLYRNPEFALEQEIAFETQIRWARESGLPIVIHARQSFREIFKVLDKIREPGLKGVFHSFSGDIKEAEKALSYGFYIGINGMVTFKNSNIAGIVAGLPLERILLETDAPFLSPEPFRGKRNESSYLIYIAGKIAEIHRVSIKELADITTGNAERLFKI
ncbi:MAG: TatD family hydrolase [Bacteroidales bacterium]|nr:TatD family hydrolase [Bacteroidales bacterium]MBN2699696.1 TatD family hydrolase [Bacteroidales bacterium]